MSVLAELKAQILETVEIHGPIGYRDLSIAVQDFADNHKQFTNQVYNLKKSGQIDQLPDGGYVMPGSDSADDEPTRPAVTRGDPAPRVIDEPADGAPCGASAGCEKGDGEFELHSIDDIDDPDDDDTVWYPQPLVREILEDQLLTAQKALDDYLMLVGEPRIIACLRAPRDAARKALEQLEED